MSSSVTIGSRPDCDLVVNIPSVSGHHCRLTRDETGLVLEDLNST
ncbi:MAG: FHA domain-containing protein, partial [Isosphaeraceae bacterium]